MTDQDTDSLHLKVLNEEWGLFRSKANVEDFKNPQYFLVWLAEEEPSPGLVAACKKLASQALLIPGVVLSMVEQPALGLVIRPKPGWNLEEGEGIAHFFEKILWELDRLKRSAAA